MNEQNSSPSLQQQQHLNNGVLLSDQFTIHRTEKLVRLDLHHEYIKLYHLTGNSTNDSSSAAAVMSGGGGGGVVSDLILNLNDVAGSSVCKGKEETDTKSYFTIYAYIKPHKTPAEASNVKRKRKTFEFAYAKFDTYDENFAHVNKWHLKMYNLLTMKSFIHQQHLCSHPTHNQEINNNNNNGGAHREIILVKPFLVFVNPKSGSGKAKNIYFERALPVWAEANIPDTAVFTRNLKFYSPGYLYFKLFS